MKAVIVAAGMGTRLHPLTEHIPKCLVSVNGQPIIDYQLKTLRDNGIREVVIVTGHMEEKIQEYVTTNHSDAFEFSFVSNPDYQSTQNAYSLFLARDILSSDPEGFVIFNSDLIFPPELLSFLISHEHQDGMIVDGYTDATNDMVKIELDGTRIIQMSKQLESSIASGEAVGPVKLSKKGGQEFFSFLEKSFEKEGVKNWLFYMLGDFGKQHPFHAVKNPGHTWAEVDTLEDHTVAEEKCKDLRNTDVG